MKNIRFTGKTLKKCVERASEELSISEEKLEYIVIENKKRLFNSRVTIEIKIEQNKICENKVENDDINLMDEMKSEKETNVQESDDGNGQEINDEKVKRINNGNIIVEKGTIVINDPIGEGKIPRIVPPKNLKIFVDGKEIKEETELSTDRVINICQNEESPKRILNIDVDNNKMNAFITIKYVPQRIYKLKDASKAIFLRLEEEVLEEKYPPIYNKEDIMKALKDKNIIYGIINENLEECLNKDGVEKLLIAQGIPFVPDEEDVIEVKFEEDDSAQVILDEVEKVDFKNLYLIKEVKKGHIIGEKHIGKEGHDGINIFGKEVKRTKKKEKSLKAGQGALINGNTVIAGLEGKPAYKNGTFYVLPVHEVVGDVDISNGNIDFIGEVIIHGNVKEGMEVKAQGKITINKNVAGSKIFSKSDIYIQKNIISSEIISGGENVGILNQIDCLNKMKGNIQELAKSVEQIENVTSQGDKYGQIIKTLIENKFRNIPKLYFKMLGCKCCNVQDDNEILDIIRNKLIGLGPVKIKSISEIYNIVEIIEEKLTSMNKKVILPVNVNIGYSQDSIIKSSGSIYINGKGEYVSQIYAKDEVIFANENSVARGGLIKADKKIQCSKVGSDGGVITKLEVEKEGHIYVKKAYQNTVFIVGSREYLLDICCRDVHVYLDSKGEINVEKFNL